MADAEETRLKAEIDEIVNTINATIRKIEQVAPFKKEAADPSVSDDSADTEAESLDKS